MSNEQDKNPTSLIHATHTQNKVIVKPANDKMSNPVLSTTFRTIQQPQMRVVRMPGTGGTGAQIIQTQIMPQTILKPTIPGRSTITVSKAPAAYLPRVTATLNTIQGTKGTQQIRTPTPPSSVAGISPAFVRTSMTPRTSSPNAVLSQGTTAWVSGAVQVPQQIIRSTITQNRITNIFGPSASNQNSTLSVSTSTSGTSGQPTYVATVLPQRPQGATIVYTSQQQQPFIQGVQRMNISTNTNTRQIRPIQRIPAASIRVNTSSLSIRQNVPGLAPTTVLATQTRNTSGLASSTTISNTIPARIFQVQSQQAPSGSQGIGQSNQKILSANVMLPIIVNNQRIAHSVKNPMQSGIIAHVSKLTSGTVSSDGTIISNSLTNTMSSISNTMVASLQPNQSVQSQMSQGNNQQQGTIYTTQSAQQVTNLGSQSGSQIITVSQQQQLMNNQQGNIHQGGNVQTVVPLAIGSRNANIPIKTITVSASNSVSMDNAVTVHRNLTSNAGNLQATTIMPIGKIVSQQQVVNQQQQNISSSGQGTPVYIHTRVPTVSTVASTAQSQVIQVSASSSTPTFSSSGTPTAVYYEQASLSSSHADKSISSTSSNNEPTYAVASPANVRYSEKMIHSIITNNFQNHNAQNNAHLQQQQQSSASNQQSVPIRFSPLVVESQSSSQSQPTSHQIITMGTGNMVQQQQVAGSDTTTHMIVPLSNQIPTSPRGSGSILRKNETSPVKAPKKQPKAKNFQIAEGIHMRVPQRQQIAPNVCTLTQTVKPVEQKQHSTASSPKTTFSERESPMQTEEWSDGSTTVSIPNSPRSEEDDLDAMIMSNQFNKINEDFPKFTSKTPGKVGSGMKRDAGEHQMTPRTKKMKK